MKLTIGYFYPNLLNLYGDRGNVEILVFRAKARDIEVQVKNITPATLMKDQLKDINILFMGGGPDSSQKIIYEDLVKNKAGFLRDYVLGEGVGLFVCGAYQLLGHYYKAADGTILDGLGILDLYTEHPGHKKKRCVGNIVCELTATVTKDLIYDNKGIPGDTIVGFENHGGRTFLGKEVSPLGRVIKGFGNNSMDGTEGVLFKNCWGTYMHGPFLARNPHVADFLIAKALNLTFLHELDDTLVIAAHTASRKLR